MKKKIILVVILVISILWTNIAIALAATKTELQNQQSEIDNKIDQIFRGNELTFLEIAVAVGSREDLGRPKETAEDNKQLFME